MHQALSPRSGIERAWLREATHCSDDNYTTYSIFPPFSRVCVPHPTSLLLYPEFLRLDTGWHLNAGGRGRKLDFALDRLFGLF